MNWGTFKTLLTDALVDHLHPIQVCVCFSYSDTLLGHLDAFSDVEMLERNSFSFTIDLEANKESNS